MLIRYGFPERPDSDDSNPVTVDRLLQLLLWLFAAFVVAVRSHSKLEVIGNSAVVFAASIILGLLSADWPTLTDRASPSVLLLLSLPLLLLLFAVFTVPALLIFLLLGPPPLDSESAA